MICRKCGSDQVNSVRSICANMHETRKWCLSCGFRSLVMWIVPQMAPGQTPYTPEEYGALQDLIQDAADSDLGEAFDT